MGLAQLFEDFSSHTQSDAASVPPVPGPDLEAMELAAFERGYQSGWEDAVRTEAEGRDGLSAAFEQSLQDLSFTYHEAYGHAMRGLRPLLQQLAERVLPEMLQESFGAHLVESILRQASGHADPSVTIEVAPERREAVSALLSGNLPFQVRVEANGALNATQADISLDDASTERVDLSGLVADLQHALEEVAGGEKMRAAHG